MFLEPKEIEIDGKIFILSKFPAVAGREIVANYSLSSLPKVGDYEVNAQMMHKLMSYVGIQNSSGQPLQLITTSLIDNHVGGWETLAKIEMAMMEYNCSFFQQGKISTFLDSVVEKLPSLITKILTGLSPQSLPAEKPRSANSKKVTR
jgi:hypothetical protein